MDNGNEVFTIVDENDNIIGYKSRYECHRDKTLIHRATGVVIFNDKGELLLQKRSQNKDTDPGVYTLSSSGHVDKGEAYKQTANRELLEELGIKIPLTFKTKFIYRSDIETEMDAIFEGQYNGSFFPNAQEVERVDFFPITKVKNMKDQLTQFAIQSLTKLNVF